MVEPFVHPTATWRSVDRTHTPVPASDHHHQSPHRQGDRQPQVHTANGSSQNEPKKKGKANDERDIFIHVAGEPVSYDALTVAVCARDTVT